jgi:SAM-dependent methyltransferase
LRDASLLFTFWRRRAEGDVLIASRHTLGGDTNARFMRRWASRWGNKLVAAALSFLVADMSGGRRMYRMRVIRDVTLEAAGRDLLVEVLVRAVGKGARVVELPWHTERPAWPMPPIMDVARIIRRMHHVRNSGNYPDYDSRAYRSKIWLQRYWQQKRYAIISRFSDRPGSAVDIGCGGSRIIKTRPDMVALDLNFDRLRHLNPTNPRRVQGTAGSLPFADRSFDTVICSQVIEHTLEGTCVSECVRVLKDGGILVIGTPDYGRVWWPFWERLYEMVKPHGYVIEHIAHYTYASLVREVTDAGCEVLEHAYIAGGELIVKAVKQARAEG